VPDVPYPKSQPPTRREVASARLGSTLDRLARAFRVTLTGYAENHSVRRSVLYLIAAGGIGIAMSIDSVVPSVTALIALMLLALTDAVVEL
jgi:hypothetical protein